MSTWKISARALGIVSACAIVIQFGATQAHAARSTQMHAAHSDLSCLATAMYFEARGEPQDGQMAVGRVILNRAADRAYPSTVCGVVYQGANRRNGCQFSFACDGVPDRISDTRTYRQIEQRAKTLLSCGTHCPGNIAARSTHFHSTSVRPRWSSKLTRLGRVGNHIFYADAKATVRTASAGRHGA